MCETRVLGMQGPLHSARVTSKSILLPQVGLHPQGEDDPSRPHAPGTPPSGTSVGLGVGDSLSQVLWHPIRSSETGSGPFKDAELFIPQRVTSTKIITEQFS